MDQPTLSLISFLLTLHLSLSGVISTTFTFVNKCDYTVWPGILSNAGVPPLSTTGFVLQTGETSAIAAPTSWGGRFWGRTLCSQDDSTGKFSCVTGDCGSGKLECAGNGALPPATLAEFTLDGAGGLDFFDVSLVDGYNVPMLVVPQGGSGDNCTATGCIGDLNGACPSELRVDGKQGAVACKSACEAFNTPEYCCSGAYGTPDTCKPSSYSEVFKSACPRAYSYAYDDKTSTFTCASADYTITFCPSPTTSQKASQGQDTKQVPGSPMDNDDNSNSNTMVYEGASYDQNQVSRATATSTHAVAATITIAIWRLCQLSPLT
ncbi:pathogenesis-related thaumatin-like protein 3.5 [Lotus japonicus]|uniref:pathogenesis-related thaumatin-like protein 3.5 n=1 Tax=Lotus japonicus TaxID=34305 RepID=UPI00258A82E6|nr:pathogenesis-related thaumatin-like protein 3.5 [Lotus japonicus]